MAILRAVVAAALLTYAESGRLWKQTGSKSSHSRSLESCGKKGPQYSAQEWDVNISIVNGDPATECEWRWQVGLRDDENSKPYCGGQLITPEWVLTAAHCVSIPDFNVVAGEYNLNDTSGNEQSRWAVQVIRHPLWNRRNYNNDFALVRLETPFEINECVGTVCLPTEGSDVPPDSKCWITGWGRMASGGSRPDVLQEAEVSILSQQGCRDSGYDPEEITDNMICAQGQTGSGEIIDACQGDSGGPLVCEDSPGSWVVYGATSWGIGCAEAVHPGVWARVHAAVGWIDETLEANSGPVPTQPLCPDFSRSQFPDVDGDCQCPWGEFCSVSNGANRDCPTSGSIGGYGGTWFQYTCEDCQCVSMR